jgi:hypothetical protein
VLESFYEVERPDVAELIRAVIGFPAIVIVDVSRAGGNALRLVVDEFGADRGDVLRVPSSIAKKLQPSPSRVSAIRVLAAPAGAEPGRITGDATVSWCAPCARHENRRHDSVAAARPGGTRVIRVITTLEVDDDARATIATGARPERHPRRGAAERRSRRS